MKPEIIFVDEAGSTNTLMAETDRSNPLPHGAVIAARRQTAGRGQRGNSWEAAPGLNITMSVMLRPEGVEASGQFALSEAVALGVALATEREMGGDIYIKVKWPNDIYAGDQKLCGILIENALSGRRIVRCIAGVGVNVNQTLWLSDAPNPVSMASLAGRTFDVEALTARIAAEILAMVSLSSTPEGRARLHELYISRLWRGTGYHRWHEAASGRDFEACIEQIAPTGHITLRERSGAMGVYAFKEVAALL